MQPMCMQNSQSIQSLCTGWYDRLNMEWNRRVLSVVCNMVWQLSCMKSSVCVLVTSLLHISVSHAASLTFLSGCRVCVCLCKHELLINFCKCEHVLSRWWWCVNTACCSYYAKLKKDEEERKKELAEKYRDRVGRVMFSRMDNKGRCIFT